MTTGEPVLVPRITEEMGHAIASQFEKRDIRPLITGRSMLLVPLKARTVVLGFMILLRHPERPVFNDMDRVTGAELAARAGLVLDNARMYTHQENVAETLQDSMLPHIPARLAGCDIATRYLPGTLLGRVGGDWFDAVKLPGARTALVVGDVMGHGLNSAAMMGQLRTAVQTMAGLDLPRPSSCATSTTSPSGSATPTSRPACTPCTTPSPGNCTSPTPATSRPSWSAPRTAPAS